MEPKVLEEAVMGDKVALEMLRAFARVAHFWDDLIDGDKNLDDASVHARMWDAVVTLPCNAFYHEHIATLAPIIANAIINWRIATNIERDPHSTPKDLGFAFVIRSAYVDLVTTCALIIGGVEHAVAIGPAVRRWIHEEGFFKYLDNLAAEQRAREGKEIFHVLG